MANHFHFAILFETPLNSLQFHFLYISYTRTHPVPHCSFRHSILPLLSPSAPKHQQYTTHRRERDGDPCRKEESKRCPTCRSRETTQETKGCIGGTSQSTTQSQRSRSNFQSAEGETSVSEESQAQEISFHTSFAGSQVTEAS